MSLSLRSARRRRPAARAGASLLEALMALVAGTIACAGVGLLLRADARLALARTRRLARTETVRIGAAVLRRELAAALPLEDVGGAGRDTLGLRLFRGFAVTCGPPGAEGVPVAFVGDRLPDPEKDSVMPLSAAGAGIPLPLSGWSRPPLSPTELGALDAASRGTGPAPCSGLPADSGRGEVLFLRLPAAMEPGTPLLLFQHGTYAISERALRFRHGDEGRQPLTGEWLDSRRSRLELLAPGAGPDAARVEAWLHFPANATARRLRVPFPNTAQAPAP